PYLIAAWGASLPIFAGLYQALKLVGYVERDEVLSNRSVHALNIIKICSIAFSLIIIAGTITTIMMAKMNNPEEDTTHIFALGLAFVFASSVTATSAAVLQQLVQNAIAIKSEHDLTI